MGCAGGGSVFCHLPLIREEFAGETLAVRVSGLVGGHSGVEINKGRANANVLMGRLLRAMAAVTELRLVSAEGGSKGNAIPTAAAAVVTVVDGSAAQKAAETLAAEIKKEYRIADPGLTVAVETVEAESLPMDEVTTGKALCMLTCLPNGVQAMSMDIPGLVQTSLNIGILKCGDDEMTAVCSVRSSVASQKQMVRDRLRCLTEQLGGSCGRGRRLSRLGISAGFSPPGADDRGLSGAVRQGAGGGDRSRRSGVRIAGRKAAGAGLRVLRPGPDGHPYPQRADAHRVRPADVEAAVRGSEAQQVNRKNKGNPRRSVLIKRSFFTLRANSVMCYGISRCFALLRHSLDSGIFPHKVIVNVDLLCAVSAGFIRRINDDFFNQFVKHIWRQFTRLGVFSNTLQETLDVQGLLLTGIYHAL